MHFWHTQGTVCTCMSQCRLCGTSQAILRSTAIPSTLFSHGLEGCIASAITHSRDERLYRPRSVGPSQRPHLQQLLLQSLMEWQALADGTDSVHILYHIGHCSQHLQCAVPATPTNDVRRQGQKQLCVRGVADGASTGAQLRD